MVVAVRYLFAVAILQGSVPRVDELTQAPCTVLGVQTAPGR